MEATLALLIAFSINVIPVAGIILVVVMRKIKELEKQNLERDKLNRIASRRDRYRRGPKK
jgi:hypothetical protein